MINSLRPSDTKWHQGSLSTLMQFMTCRRQYLQTKTSIGIVGNTEYNDKAFWFHFGVVYSPYQLDKISHCGFAADGFDYSGDCKGQT